MTRHWLDNLVVALLASLLALPVAAQDEEENLLDDLGDGGAAAAPADDAFDPFDFSGGRQQGPTPEELAAMQAEASRFNDAGRAKVEQGDVQGAIAEFEAAIGAMSNFDSYFELGRLQREEGRTAEAIQNLSRAVSPAIANEVEPSIQVQAYQELGQAYLDEESYNQALQVFSMALRIPQQNRNPELFFGLALAQTEFALNQKFAPAQTREDDLRNALTTFDRAISIDPEYAEALFERGSTRLLLGEIEDAVDDLVNAARIDASNSEYAAQLGFAHLRFGLVEAAQRRGQRAKIIKEYQSAAAEFTRYFTLEPNELSEEEQEETDIRRETVFVSRAAAYLGLGDETQDNGSFYYRKAIVDCEAALEIEPELSDAHLQKGIALRMLGQFNESLASYTAALEIAPTNWQSLLRRGIVYYRLGDFDLAMSDFQTCKRFSNPTPALYFWTGLAHVKQDRPQDAIQEYALAIRSDPFFTLAYFNRGLAYLKIGRFNRAAEDFNQVLRRENDNAQAKQLRDEARRLAKQN